MSLKKHLPYLGKETEPGIFYGEHSRTMKKIERPDYNSFKIGEYKTAADCVAALTGIENPNHLYYFYDAVMKRKVKKVWVPDEIYQIMKENKLDYDDCPAKLPLDRPVDIETDQRMIDARLILDLFHDIAETIGDGIEAKAFSIIYEDGARDPRIFFSETVKYEKGPFLTWMSTNGYQIPEELAFHENTANLSARRFIKKGDMGEISFDSETELSPDDRLDNFLIEINPDLQTFYDSFKLVLTTHMSNLYSDKREPNLTSNAAKAFNNVQTHLKNLTVDDFGDIFSSLNVDHKYKIIGRLAKNLITRIHPDLSKIEPSSQKLQTRLNQLKKKT